MYLSIIIVNYNVYEDVKVCIASIYKYFQDIAYEVIVVDNNSTDESILDIKVEFPEVKLILLDENNGFGSANNAAMKTAIGKYLFFINPDIVFVDNTPKTIVDFLDKNPQIGAAGPVQVKPGAGIEYYYSFFPSIYSRLMQEFGFFTSAPILKNRFRPFWDQNIVKRTPFKVDWVIGSCLLMRKNIYDELGGFDEAFFLYEEEVEWQYRMNEAGWSSYILPECEVLHNHHSSTYKIGVLFVLYHEYRSRIIFSAKRYKFPKSILRKLLTLLSLVFRFLYYSLIDCTSSKVFLKRTYLYFDLFKLTLSTKKKLLAKRFNFDSYKYYFTDTGNAKL